MSNEILQIFINDTNYNDSSYISEWLNVASSASIIINIFLNKTGTAKIDYSNDENYQIIKTDTKPLNGTDTTIFYIQVKHRFLKLTVDGYSTPVNMKVQGFHLKDNIIHNLGGDVSISNLDYGAFGAIKTFQYIVEHSYLFNYSTISGRDAITTYTDIKTNLTTSVTANFYIDLDKVLYIRNIGDELAGVKTFLKTAFVNYRSGIGSACSFSCIWDTSGYVDTYDRLLTGLGYLDSSNNLVDALFVGYTELSNNFCILYKRNGSETIINQSSFNINRLDGSNGYLLDTSKVNLFRIIYSYHGIGNLQFEIFNNEISRFIPFHTIRISNSITETNLIGSGLQYIMYTERTGGAITNGENCKIGISGVSLGSEGIRSASNDRHSVYASKLTVSAEALLFAIRNGATLNTIDNRTVSYLDFFNASVDGTKNVRIKMYKGTVNGGAWSLIDSTGSAMEVNTTGTLNTGIVILELLLGKTDKVNQSIKDLDIRMNPGDIIIITGQSIANTDIDCSLSFYEYH